jgi:acetyl-CoA acyltransferase 1
MESQRLNMLNGPFNTQPTYNARSVQAPSDDDVVLVSMARTAMTRAKKGPQKDTAPEAMLAPVLKDVLVKANNMDAKHVQEICIGNVLQPGAGSTTSRMGQFLAGIPHTTPLIGINRLCSSGLQAVATVANQIKSGEIDCGIGGGVESMSMFSMMG